MAKRGGGGGEWSLLPSEECAVLEAAWQAQEHTFNFRLEDKSWRHIDLRKMQIFSPEQTSLRRRVSPALWIQYAHSTQAYSMRTIINRLQVLAVSKVVHTLQHLIKFLFLAVLDDCKIGAFAVIDKVLEQS